jgi:hypothetical protein
MTLLAAITDLCARCAAVIGQIRHADGRGPIKRL